MTVSTLPAILVPETSAEAVPALGVAIPSRDAVDAAGVVAAFPLLLQLLQQNSDPAPPQAEPMSPGSWDMALVRGLLPVAHGAAAAEAESRGASESVDETEADRSEMVLAGAVLAAVPAPALAERPAPPATAARLPEPLGSPAAPSGPVPAPDPTEPLRAGPAVHDAPPSGLSAQAEETTAPGAASVTLDGIDEATASLDEWQGRPQSMRAGSDSTPLRAEGRTAGVGPVVASRRDETRSDAGAGGGDDSSDRDPRAVEPSARVDRGGAVAGMEPHLRVAAEVSEPPASSEPLAPRPLVEQVVTRLTPLRQGRQEMSLRLEPPDLGSIRVEAVLDGQRLTLRITAEQESAKSLLEGTLPRLRESLSQQGFVTDQLTVQLGLDASAREFAGRAFPRFERPVPPDLPARAAESASAPSRWRESITDGLDLWA